MHILRLSYTPAVIILLEQSDHSVAEVDVFAEVCAVLQGQLARDLEVELRTEGDTASESTAIYFYS